MRSYRRYFILDTSSTVAADGVEVLNAPVGRWIWAEHLHDHHWQFLNRGAGSPWTINTSTGNDENDGSAANPLLTVREYFRRMRPSILHPLTASQTINITGDLAASDFFAGELHIQDGGVEIDFIFTPTNIGAQSTFTALLLKNRATPQNWSPTDGATGNLAAGNIGYQLFDSTANAGAGAVGWVDSTAAAAQGGGGQVTLTEMFRPLVAGNGNPVLQAIANGDTYQLRRPAQARLGDLRVSFRSAVANVLAESSVRFYNVWWTNFNATGSLANVKVEGFGTVQFCQARTDQKINVWHKDGQSTVNFFNCLFGGANGTGANNAAVASYGPGVTQIYGGGDPTGGGGAHSVSVGQMTVDADYVKRTATSFLVGVEEGVAGTLQLGNVCSYGPDFGTMGPAASIGGGGFVLKVGSYTSTLLWGAPTVANGNLFKLRDGGVVTFSGTLATILGNLPVGTTISCGGATGINPPIFLTATLAYAAAPAGGATITNLIAAQPGGYGNAFNDPTTGCRLAAA